MTMEEAKLESPAGSDNSQGPGPPVPVSFFNPALKPIRRRVFYQLSRTLLILCVFVISILSLYWGCQFDSVSRSSTLTVWVVDFDGQVDPYRSNDTIVGPAVTDVIKGIIQSNIPHLGFTIKPPADFHYDPWAVRQGVYNEHAYAAVIVNPNATSLLRGAVVGGNTTYDPTGAVQTVIISARDQTTYPTFVQPQLFALEALVSAEFGPRWARELVMHVSTINLSQVPPQAINPGIGFTNIDLRPFTPAVAIPSVTVGLIYLIIIAFFNFPFLMPIHSLFMKSDGHPPLKVPQWIIWRMISAIIAYFFLSLFYSLVSLAYQIPFSNPPAPDTQPVENPNPYGRGSFVVFWMLNWVGMAALGLPCENMAMVLGFPWSSLFLIFWVITNVATAFYALDLAPGFYAWGYVWPLHRIVEASRTILFDTHSRIGLDFGVLFVWIAVSLLLYPLAAFVMQWKMKRGL